jgi:hypothetical protein
LRRGSYDNATCPRALTVKNRTLEETKELEQEILRGALELIVTKHGTTLLDVGFGDSVGHVSLEPVKREEKGSVDYTS